MPETHGDPLSDHIRDHFPFPISHTYTYMESRLDPNARYLALLACFEATLKYIASIALAQFFQDVQQDPGLGNIGLFQQLLNTLKQPLSLGHWQTLLRITLRPYAPRKEKLLVPEIFDFYYRLTEQGNVKGQGNHVRLLQGFIKERNEEAHHRNRAQVSFAQRQARQPELEQNLEKLLQSLSFLAQYTLLYVEHAEYHNDCWHYRANIARGMRHPFCQDTIEVSQGLNSRHCILQSEKTGDFLDLHPFLIVTAEDRLQQPDIFFFDGVFRSGRANFMSYHVNNYLEPADESSPAGIASDAISSLLSFLQKQIQLVGDGKKAEAHENIPTVEIYQQALQWAWEHGERQHISLNALREMLELTREQALQEEKTLKAQLGLDVEPEEIPFEGIPTWANLAHFVLDRSGQEELFYKDIAAKAARLKDLYDPKWQLEDSANIEASVSGTMSRDPRFYKVRRGYYRLTRHSELLSNPSWANLAHFVLQHRDKKRRGMHLSDISKYALELKVKYSDWNPKSAQTPERTVSATMSTDHRFESLPKRGFWRLAEKAAAPAEKPAEKRSPPTTRKEAYGEMLERLGRLGPLTKLPFGYTYYALDGTAHLMLRYSRAHQRGEETEYFMGVQPQYVERIQQMGHGFLLFVLGSVDNVLLVPVEDLQTWVKGQEPSGSGTWPLSFYQKPGTAQIERWVPGGGRADVSIYLNNDDLLRQALGKKSRPKPRPARKTIRMVDLLEAGLIRPGDQVYTRKNPEIRATVIDAEMVEYEGKSWTYTGWGAHVNGWTAINVYQSMELARTGQALDELRKELRRKRSKG